MVCELIFFITFKLENLFILISVSNFCLFNGKPRMILDFTVGVGTWGCNLMCVLTVIKCFYRLRTEM